MDQSLFTIYYENPYWVGIIEHTVDGSYSVARIVFGPEPTDAEILEYLFKNYPNNLRFTKPVEGPNQCYKSQHINPKRRQREAANLLAQRGTSTKKAHEAIQRSYEQYKQEKHKIDHKLKDEEAEQKYLRKIEKKKQKKRGR